MKINLSISLNKIWALVYVLYTIGSFGVNMLSWNDIWVQIPLYLFFLISAIAICNNTNLFSKRIATWYIGFVIISLVSLIYTASFSNSFIVISDLIMAMLWAISLGAFLFDLKNLNTVMYANIVCAIPMGIYLIATFSQEYSWSRLGESFGVNENIVALCFLVPFCFAFIETYNKHHIILNIVALIVSSYVMLLAGSKKAFFGAILFVLILVLVGGKLNYKKVLSVIGVILLIIALFYIVLHNMQLYNIIGYRLELFWSSISGNSIKGTSTLERSNMISFGLKLFAESPIFGHGLNSFSFYYGNATGFYAYAHNNYIELASSLGIVGFGWFYSMHVFIAKDIVRIRKHISKNAPVIALLFVIMFYDIAMVSYCDTRIILLIIIAFFMARKNYLTTLANEEMENHCNE